MKKILIGISVLIAITLIVLILPKNNNTNVSGIKIGVIAPLTGPLAEYGEAFKNGIVLAQEKNPDSNVTFVFEDSAEDPKKAISAFYKLRDQDKVSTIFNWGAASSQAIAPLIQDSNIVLLSNSSEPAVTKSSEYIVRTAYKAEDYASTMWKYFREKGQKNIGIVKLDIVFLNELLRGLQSTKNADEKVFVVDNYLSFGDSDFRTSILKLRNNPNQLDILGVFLVQGQLSKFYTQANTYGLKLPTFGTDVFESQNELINAGKYMNGAVYALNDFSDSFKQQYKARFGNIGQLSYAANAYDIATILMTKTNFKNRESILFSIKSASDYDGVAGIYKYMSTSDDRFLSAPVVLKTISNSDINSGK